MNRLRILKQRIRRAGDVGVCKLDDGYAVVTGRFQGDCSASMSKRSAIQLAARWARPCRPQDLIVTQGTTETTYRTNSRGETTVTTKQIAIDAG